MGRGPSGGGGFVGGETGAITQTGVTISIFDRGLGASPYGRSSALRLPATVQTLPHEVGHVIDAQLSAEFDDFFTNVVGWRQYSWAWVSTANSPHPNWRSEREALRAELGVTDAALQAFLDSLQPNVSVDRNGRRYTHDGSFLNSVLVANIPQGVEFEYAKTNQGDYVAEIYALAAARPQWLHTVLPPAQVMWLKRNVFRTPATATELINDALRRLALADPMPVALAYAREGGLLFSRRQLDVLLNRLVAHYGSLARGSGSA